LSIQFTQLQCKEVICIADGRRLGYVADVQVELPEGRICALIVPGPGKCLGAFGKHDTFCIPWGCIRKIGPDIVLVDADPAACRMQMPRRSLRG
jgi:YlmC/YmxH family sporulation protein